MNARFDKPSRGLRVGPVDDTDRYLLGPAVGSGAEGILYRGTITTSSGLDLEVAIKMLQPRFMDQVEQWRTRWIEQLEVLRSLQVPGLVPVRDGFVGSLPHSPGEAGEGRTLYLVMNWVEGEPLDDWVRHRPERDPVDDLKVLIPVAAALDLMHLGRATGGVPVVHRDVKPSNILVTDTGTVLVDFGLTRGLPKGQRLSGVVGTPGYLAPEAAESGSYSAATDRYAFGAVAYFVLTGTEPPQNHQLDVLRSSLSAVPALSQRPEIVDRVMAMMDTDPEARPTGLANWVGQLRHSSLPSLPEDLSPQAPRRHPGASRRRSARVPGRTRRLGRPLVVGTAAVALLGAAVGIGLSLSGGGSGHPATTQGPVSPTTLASHQSQQVITGTVRDEAGQPIPGAYVIGLESGNVVRTEPSGVFSMSCELSTNGVAGRRAEPLVAATWLLPIASAGQGSTGADYGSPSVSGLGYSFSGGASDAAGASIASCDGQTFNFVLGPGGNVDVEVLDSSGNPVVSSAIPPDNFYLPGLGSFAALYTVAPSTDGHQRLFQLAAGVLRIDGAASALNCSGPGVVADPAAVGADVAVVPGRTISVVCRQVATAAGQ